MKFRNPETGEVYDDIYAARSPFCKENRCSTCVMPNLFREKELPSGVETCVGFCEKYPHEAARLMGYEVVEEMRDPQLNEGEMDKEMEKTHFSAIKEDNMDKPLKDWTFSEVQEYCKKQRNTPELCSACKIQKFCDKYLGRKGESASPKYWGLSEPPRWTQQEVESAKIISVLFPEATHIERLRGSKVLGITGAEDGWIADIESSLFPEIKSGQFVTLDEIIRGAE